MPGAAISNLRVNLYNLATAPSKVTDSWQKTLRNTLNQNLITRHLEDKLVVEQVLGALGGELVGADIRNAFSAWVYQTDSRSDRIEKAMEIGEKLETSLDARRSALQEQLEAELSRLSDPAHVRVRLEELKNQGVKTINGVDVEQAYRGALFAELKLKDHQSNYQKALSDAAAFESRGDTKRAASMRANAEFIQKNLNKDLGRWQSTSKGYRQTWIGEAASSIQARAAALEASYKQLSTYLRNRNIRYGVHNFLTTLRKDGVGGVFREYAWKSFTKRLGSLYPPNAIRAFLKKTPILKPLQIVNQWRAQLTSLALKGITQLARKLGLGRILGAALGSALPGAGTALGAVLGAVIQFAGEVVIEKLGGVLKLVGYTIAGAMGCVMLVLVGFVILVSIILSDYSAAEGIDCDQTATATDACVASKAAVKNIADNWGVGPGNHVEECYNDVIAKSKEVGVDPRISMTIWLNESNASNYELYKRLGEPPQDFGIPARAGDGFTAQITTFLNFYKSSHQTYASCYQGYSDAEGFFRAFCTAGREEFGVGQCPNLTGEGEDCVDIYTGVYSSINRCQ